MHVVGLLRRRLDPRDERNGLFLVLVAFFFRLALVDLEQLLIAQIFLHDNAGRAVNRVDLRDRNVALQKQTGYVQIGMKFRVEWFGIDGGNRGAFFPPDAVILAGRRVRSQWDYFGAGYSLLRDESRQSV